MTSFRPPSQPGEGGAENHWVLDDAGALVVAADLGLDRAELRWQRQAALAIASSSKLAHQLAVNEFFTRLAEEAREVGGALEQWWGERRSRKLLVGIVMPDGYGRLRLPDEPALEFLLELDRGNEEHARLREKARRYAKALPRSDLSEPVVLLLVPSPARARRVAETLADTAAPIVAAAWSPESGDSPVALARDARTHAASTHRAQELAW